LFLGDTEVVTLTPDWSASPGDYLIEAYTSMPGDEDSSNDYYFADVTIEKQIFDVGVTSIDYPIAPVCPGLPFEPQATVENFGSQADTFGTEFWITTDLQMFESWENPILTSGFIPEVEEENFETYID
jgi:hypothetical protein